MRRINITIDARQLVGQRKGIGRYLYSLLDAMSAHKHQWHIELLFHKELPQTLPAGEYSTIVLPAPNTYLWEQVALPLWLFRHRPQLFFSPANCLPLWHTCPTVLALHDAMMFRPQLSTTTAQRYYDYQAYMLKFAAAHCRAIITVSHFSATEITRFLGNGVRPLLRVIAEGVEPHFLQPPSSASLQAFLRKFELEQGYMLHFASAVPRKGTHILLGALAKLKAQGISLPQLFLPGLSHNDDVVLRWLAELDIPARTAPYLSEEELPLAYTAAGILLYPSIWEGFGLPLLEGMASGLPVIAADATSIPELAGDAAWLVSPGSVTELADRIHHWMQDQEAGSKLGEKAQQRARRYTWENTAQEVLAVWEDATLGITR